MKKAEEVFRISNFRKTYLYLKKNGFSAAFFAVLERLHSSRHENYDVKELSLEERRKQKDMDFFYRPKISILVPAFETGEAHLREMIESVLAQTYTNFELIIADASETDRVGRVICRLQEREGRIVYRHLEKNKGISGNSNEALRYATGDYIGLLDHDDVLTEDALFEVVQALNMPEKQTGVWKLLYSDEDKGDGELKSFYEPHFKEDYNLDLLLSNNYICHFLVMEADLMKSLGFRREFDGAQDYDLILRAVGCLAEDEVCHIPKVLYHWRCHRGSTAENPASKMYAYEAGKRALEDFVRGRGWKAEIGHTQHLGFYKIRYLTLDGKPERQGTAEALFENRKDVGAVGGRLLRHGRVMGGAYQSSGSILYKGTAKHFSGYMHRAVLCQDVDAVDLRCIHIRQEFQGEYERLTQRIKSMETKDCETMDAKYIRASIKFCKIIKKKGYRILWNPEMERSL